MLYEVVGELAAPRTPDSACYRSGWPMASPPIELRMAIDLAKLRCASEDHVIDALESSYAEQVLDGVSPDVLLEFWGLMLNHMSGDQDE